MLSVFRAAVLAQPPVTKVVEMVGFIHEVLGVECRIRGVRPKPHTRHWYSYYRRGRSGASVRRTGTVVLRPFRTTATCTVSPI